MFVKMFIFLDINIYHIRDIFNFLVSFQNKKKCLTRKSVFRELRRWSRHLMGRDEGKQPTHENWYVLSAQKMDFRLDFPHSFKKNDHMILVACENWHKKDQC